MSETKKQPKVSIVIPTYKRKDIILSAVSSVLNQTEKDIEIIVVDDASFDGTGDIVSSCKDERVRYISLSENKGGSTARNVGVAAARAPIVAFLDSDDTWLPDKLEKQLCIPKPAGDWFVYNAVVDCGVYGRTVYPSRSYKPESDVISTFIISQKQYLFTSGFMMPKSLALRFPFDEEIRRHQDTDLAIRLALAHIPFIFCDYPLVFHLWNNTGHVGLIDNTLPTRVWMNKVQKNLSNEARAWLLLKVAQVDFFKAPKASLVLIYNAFTLSPRICFASLFDFIFRIVPNRFRTLF